MFQRLRRRAYLTEPPVMGAPDIAFTLIVFFLICASAEPDAGRPQTIPRAEEEQTRDQPQTIEVSLTPGQVLINGELFGADQVERRLAELLRGTTTDEQRVVTVKSSNDTPYERWIEVTAGIQRAGGIITLRMEAERTLTVE